MPSYNVINTGAITGDNTLTWVPGSNVNINGEIAKIVFKRGDARAAGSLFVYESGTTPEQIFLLKTTLQTDNVYYPFVYAVDNTNGTGSPHGEVKRVVNAPLMIVGSGWGNAGSSISGLLIYYR